MGTQTQTSFLAQSTLVFSWMNIVFWILHVISNPWSRLSWSCVISCLHSLCVCVCVTNTVTNTVCFSMPRCSILENDTVQCDTDLYRSLQAWKDHKLHIDHEVSDGFSVVFCGLIGSCWLSVCLSASGCLCSSLKPFEFAGWFWNRHFRTN